MKGAALWIPSTIIITATTIMDMVTTITIMQARNAAAATTKRLKTWWCAIPSAA